jgi:ketosteroid isomerase-like protein
VTTPEDGQRRINRELYCRMLQAQNVGDRSTWLSCLSADIVFEAPSYGHEGPVASGLAAMSDVFDGIRRTFSSVCYEVQGFIPAVDPDLVIAEVRGDNVVASTQKRYRNDYLFLVQCGNGKITRIFEYSNPLVYAAAVTPH